MRIVQLVPTMAYGDAIGNDVLAIRRILRSLGYKSDIFAFGIGPGLSKEKIYPYKAFRVSPDDVVIYHMATGTDINDDLPKYKCRKIMIYHNITPPKYFLGYNDVYYGHVKRGKEQLYELRDVFDYCIAVSEFNKEDLIKNDYKCKIDILPVIIPFDDYNIKPSHKVIRKYSKDPACANLLFVGRVAPNKKFEDIISVFYYYQKLFNDNSKLFLVGSTLDMDLYYNKLCEYTRVIGAENVIFTGHIKFEEIVAYYKVANAFICCSEHEGLCVPIVEAMHFDLPVVAYNNAAIPYTLGGSGVLLDKKDPILAAGVINRFMTDPAFKAAIINKQREQLTRFSYETVKDTFIKYLNNFLGNTV